MQAPALHGRGKPKALPFTAGGAWLHPRFDSPPPPCASSGPPDQPRLIIQVHPPRTAVSQGSEVTLRCHVSGEPPHYFYWSREDGHPVPGTAQRRQQGESVPAPSWAAGKGGGRPIRGGAVAWVPRGRMGRGSVSVLQITSRSENDVLVQGAPLEFECGSGNPEAWPVAASLLGCSPGSGAGTLPRASQRGRGFGQGLLQGKQGLRALALKGNKGSSSQDSNRERKGGCLSINSGRGCQQQARRPRGF